VVAVSSVQRPLPTDNRHPKEIGTTVEYLLCQRLPALEPVGDASIEWADAVVDGEILAAPGVTLFNVSGVGDGCPVEIKSCRQWTGNGERRAAGRFYVKQAAHERLREESGVYALVVTDPFADDQLAEIAIVPAAILDRVLEGSWYDVDSARSEGSVAKVSWRHVLDPEGPQ
jgi:hypothetical protein